MTGIVVAHAPSMFEDLTTSATASAERRFVELARELGEMLTVENERGGQARRVVQAIGELMGVDLSTDIALGEERWDFGNMWRVWEAVDTQLKAHRSHCQQLNAVLDVVCDIEEGVHATAGRDFGRGMAHAARLIREAMQG